MKVEIDRIVVPRGPRVPEVASFVDQLDTLSRYMHLDLRGITPAELAWQPKRGHNTIGMLLIHIAIVEAYWILVAGGRYSDTTLRRTLGVGVDDDGIPLAAGAGPPAPLRGRTFAWYTSALRRARRLLRRESVRFGRADLDRFVERTRRNGQRTRHNIRWILFHILEHQAGHYGQILMLRHQYRDRRRAR